MTPSPGDVDVVATLAVLGGAVLHAGWNAVAHGISDRLVGFTLIGLGHTGVGAVVVALAGLPAPAAWPYIVASAVVHVLYQTALMASYHLGEFSQMYPLARGTSPLVVAVVSVTVLGQALPPVQLAGVVMISIGITSLVFVGGRPTRAQLPPLAAAFGTGVLTATYTLVDAAGVQTTDVVSYAGWMFVLAGPSVPLVALATRRRALLRHLRGPLWAGLGGGVVSLVAYGLVLWALTRDVAAPVAALRETSVIFGALIGAVVFHERLGRRRVVAAGVVAAGVIVVSSG